MNWTKDKSAKLSLVCIAVFAAILAAVDIGCVWICRWYAGIRFGGNKTYTVLLALSVYLLSIAAWICLYKLWKLLKNIMAGNVFTDVNVQLLRAVSWCCAAAAAVSFFSGIYYILFMVPAAAAGFMMLIVRVVKNVFRQAVDMKSELDLTI